MGDIPGSSDCEAHVEAWGQRVLLSTSLAYLVAAVFVMWWGTRRHSANHGVSPGPMQAYAAGLALVGLGSLDYHGPALGPEPLLHDIGPAVAALAALSFDLRELGVRRDQRIRALTFLLLTTVLGVVAGSSLGPLLAGLVMAWVLAEAVLYRRGVRAPSWALFAALACAASGTLAYALSRTGGPWCDPRSWVQGHGVWHVLSAAALGLWAVTALPEPSDRMP